MEPTENYTVMKMTNVQDLYKTFQNLFLRLTEFYRFRFVRHKPRKAINFYACCLTPNTLFALTLSVLLSCQQNQEKEVIVLAEISDFSFLDKSLAAIEKEIGDWGGGSKKKFNAIEQENCTYSISQGKLMLSMGEKDAFFQISPRALGFPLGWHNADELLIDINSEEEIDLIVQILGSRSRLQEKISVLPDQESYRIDIREAPLLGGVDEEVLKIKIIATKEADLLIQQMQLLDTAEDFPLVDQWGQRNLKEYSNKISSKEELFNLEKEADFLASLPATPATDAFGGYLNHNLNLKKTGYFRTQKVDEKWYLVSPEGNPFYSLGLNGVRRKSTLNNAALTKIEGREDLFEKVPAYADCPECFNEDSAYLSFYNHNVKLKYDTYEDWTEQVLKRLERIGFNTIGNWSDSLFIGSDFPYTYTLDSREGTGLEMQNDMPDVFHPEWEQKIDAAFSHLASLKNDPYLIGYFVDNEMSWRSITKWDSTSYTFKKLSKLADEESQKKAFAERYFSTIKNAIKKNDPNHLYMGCRFTRNFKGLAPAAQAAGNYLDVLSINVYSAVPIREQLDEWYAAVQKPMIISEHHIPPATERALLPIYPAFELAERDAMLKEYLQTWLTFPYAVGSHWYQYADQEVSGRMDGGENQPVGIVSVTDQLHQPIVKLFNEMAIEIAKTYVEPLEQ